MTQFPPPLFSHFVLFLLWRNTCDRKNSERGVGRGYAVVLHDTHRISEGQHCPEIRYKVEVNIDLMILAERMNMRVLCPLFL